MLFAFADFILCPLAVTSHSHECDHPESSRWVLEPEVCVVAIAVCRTKEGEAQGCGQGHRAGLILQAEGLSLDAPRQREMALFPL